MTYYIIDFDSTFIKKEGLDELASVALTGHKDKNQILDKIKEITRLGMDGHLPFATSLRQRIKLLPITKSNIQKTVAILKKNISTSIKRNKSFFQKYHSSIYIISGGFKELIIPIVKEYGIDSDQVIANSFVFKGEKVAGYDEASPLAQNSGKIKAIKALELKGEIIAIGDGITDYEIKQMGIATRFNAFTENVTRKAVTEKADRIIRSFDEFLYINHLPMSLSYPKSRIKVLLLENIHSRAISLFQDEGYQVESIKASLDRSTLIDKIKDVNILGIRSRTQIDQELIFHAPRLLAVGAYCIGTNQIDLTRCAQSGIAAFNAPYSNTRSVVELTLGEIIMLIRKTFYKSQQLHTGVWDKSAIGCREIRGKTLGIVGYGNIGAQLSVLAENLGMKVYFYDKVDKLALGNAHKCATLKELLRKCDVVTIHVDGAPQNKNLIGEKEFAAMKDGVIFLNLSRGMIVDIGALTKYIKNGKIKGAAVDVFPTEPKSNAEKFVSPLQGLPNVILTPHVGGSTEEAQYNIGEFVTQKIIDYINFGNTFMSVNLPNIQQLTQKNAHRLLHLHDNVPGILAQINNILAQNNINILGQYLKTNDQIGYVITDVNKVYDEKVITELKNIPHTIRFRVLY